eukprot:1712582-Lingulodinium_polyedra.AAC.1
MGQGSSSAGDARATFPEKHARSFLLLRRVRKDCRRRLGVVNVPATRMDLLCKYLWVCQQFFPRCAHLV